MSSIDRICQRSLWMAASLGLCASAAFGDVDLALTADCKGWVLDGTFDDSATVLVTGTLFQTVEGEPVPIEEVLKICSAPAPNEPGTFDCSGTWVTGGGELPFGEYNFTVTAVVSFPMVKPSLSS